MIGPARHDTSRTAPAGVRTSRSLDTARLFTLTALAVLAGPAGAQAPPCNGTYEYFGGKSFTEVEPGNTLPKAGRVAQAYNNREGWVGQVIRKPQSEGMVEVEVSQCGRQFVLSQGGKRMLFLQGALDDTLYVAQDIGTDEAELTMRVVDHKAMVGKIEGSTHGFKFTFPVAMEPQAISMPDMTGCDDDEGQADPARDDNRQTVDPELRSEVRDIIADRIDLPRDLASRYISVPETVAQSAADAARKTRLVPGEQGCTEALDQTLGCFDYGPETGRPVAATMILDARGQLLPLTRRADGSVVVDDPAAADYCTRESTYPAPEHRLSIKLWSPEGAGSNSVQATLSNYDARITEISHFADGEGAGREVRVDAVKTAYEGIGAPVTGYN